MQSQKSYNDSPTVYLIPTPIGNLEDITLRSINTLKKVDIIFSEDTRETSLLLKHLDIHKPLISSHNFNEKNNIDKLLNYLNDGKNIGVVTDRGTPIISDPGYELVKASIKNNYNVVALPGPTAFVPALITSNLAPQPFLFYGFLSSKNSGRKKELEKLSKYPFTIIFYESPHRIQKTLQDILEIMGNRQISISREISKKYEEIYRGNVEEVINQINPKGEMVLVLEGHKNEEDNLNYSIEEHIGKYLDEGLDSKEAIKRVAKDRNIAKNEVYKIYHRGER